MRALIPGIVRRIRLTGSAASPLRNRPGQHGRARADRRDRPVADGHRQPGKQIPKRAGQQGAFVPGESAETRERNVTDVRLEQISKRFPDAQVDAVRDVSLTIGGGQLMCLLGPSGCGKTTTLKIIAGLTAPDRGAVCVGERDVTAVPAEKRDVVMVFQNHLLFPFLSVEENIAFGLRMRHAPKAQIREKVREMMSLLRLDGLEGRRPAQLSGGQKQRVALARALVTEPRVLLLDEPLSNLDAHLRDEMRELILSIKRRMDITIIFVTHDQEEAVLLADRIAVMFDGEIIQTGPPSHFYERPATREIAEFFGNRNMIEGEKQGPRVQTDIGTLSIPDTDIADGPVCVGIRPDAIVAHIESPARTPQNFVTVPVGRRLYMGTHTRLRVRVSSYEWDVYVRRTVPRDQELSEIGIELPPESIKVFPR
jgi:putative spermidine/putrescine transport system ATP-binding protein